MSSFSWPARVSLVNATTMPHSQQAYDYRPGLLIKPEGGNDNKALFVPASYVLPCTIIKANKARVKLVKMNWPTLTIRQPKRPIQMLHQYGGAVLVSFRPRRLPMPIPLPM